MPRADLLINLVKAGTQRDDQLFRSTVEAIAAEERAKRHTALAERLEENLNQHTSQPARPEVVRSFDGGHGGLLFEVQPRRTLGSLVLAPHIVDEAREFIDEHHRVELLRSYGLEPRHRLLLEGPPGNGKTSLAEAIAHELIAPLFVVRYEAVIGSFLGETSGRLKRLFDFVRTHRCVLFFDEFDTLGKERGDIHDTGEIKRVVSSLLLQIDSLPSHVVVVTATNHPELLDRAVWRRFQLRMVLAPPSKVQKINWFRGLESAMGSHPEIPAKRIFASIKAESFSDLEQFSQDAQRRFVLSLPNGSARDILLRTLASWARRVSPRKRLARN